MKKLKIEKPKNDIIYTRVSSAEQTLGFSLESQEKTCRELSRRDEHSVFMLFREEGESAKTADRTELKKMMLFCDKNKKQISRLVVYKIDRLSRSVSDYQVLKMFFNKLGITIVSATEHFKDDPAGKLNENILSAFAQFDNDVRSARTIEGLKARLMRGLWATISPFGYKNTRDAADGKVITPDPEKAPIVKMLFEQYATSKYTFKELASMANKMGVKSMHGRKIHKQLVSKIISNPIYHGMIVFPKFGISLMGTHEPVITQKLFSQAQYVRNGGNLGRKLPRSRDNQNYPLRGIKCSGCNGNLTAGKTRSKTGKYHDYYSCMKGECPKRTSIKKVDMENDFTNFLVELTHKSDYLDVLKETIKLAHKSELNSITTTERKLNTKISELKAKKDKLLNLRIEGKISDEDFTPANEKIKFEILESEREVNSLFSPELEVDNVVDSGIEFLKHLPELWRDLNVKDLRVLRTLLFPENVFYHYPNIKTPEACCIYNVKPEFLDEKTGKVTLRGIEPRFKP